MLEQIANDIWTQAQPLRFFGVEIGTRMTVVRLGDGSLFVHSPVALDEATKEALAALGPVQAVVAPCLFHHLYVGEWARAYPAASLSACPGLPRKRSDQRWTHVLGDEPPAAWEGELDQVFFGAFSMTNEIVFFHRKSRTILSCDLIFNLAAHPSRLTRTVARIAGQREPGATLLERVLIRDRAAAREQIGRIVAWEAERVVLAHGDIIASGATEVVRRAYRWL